MRVCCFWMLGVRLGFVVFKLKRLHNSFVTKKTGGFCCYWLCSAIFFSEVRWSVTFMILFCVILIWLMLIGSNVFIFLMIMVAARFDIVFRM